jgi:hypothetical protein
MLLVCLAARLARSAASRSIASDDDAPRVRITTVRTSVEKGLGTAALGLLLVDQQRCRSALQAGSVLRECSLGCCDARPG